MNIYDITVKNAEGKDVSLSQYKNKVLLIVNTATGCGFTPQYEGLQKLYEKYADKGLVVLDFPCNQFGAQAPGTMEQISDFCALKYHTTFPLFMKIDVNGENESPLFAFLKDKQKGVLGSRIKWNFTKFLIGKDGQVVGRYSPDKKPELIEKDIMSLLEA